MLLNAEEKERRYYLISCSICVIHVQVLKYTVFLISAWQEEYDELLKYAVVMPNYNPQTLAGTSEDQGTSQPQSRVQTQAPPQLHPQAQAPPQFLDTIITISSQVEGAQDRSQDSQGRGLDLICVQFHQNYTHCNKFFHFSYCVFILDVDVCLFFCAGRLSFKILILLLNFRYTSRCEPGVQHSEGGQCSQKSSHEGHLP